MVEADGWRAPAYDDVYCARGDGLAEARHVFIDGNDLSARFAAWPPGRAFVIGETGFGLGRNMLLAWQTFCRVAPADARLHLVSIEKHPVTADDLASALSRWPALADEAARLSACWPAPVTGWHRLVLDDRVTFDLYLGDVEEALAQFVGRVDAWFLDGFAPARNPAMWSPAVCRRMAAASRPGATFATYSAAGVIKQALGDAGFTWWRPAGFGRKRHMLAGRLAADEPRLPMPEAAAEPWFQLPAPTVRGPIAVVGAGIAGATVAEALARRGYEVTVFDRAGPAAGASGNRDAVINPRLAVEASPRTRFDLAALAYIGCWLADRDPGQLVWQACGVLQLARDADSAARQQRLIERLALPATVAAAVDAETAAGHAGTPLAGDIHGALWFPGAGVLQPAALCAELLAGDRITLVSRDVEALRRVDNAWQLTLDDGSDQRAEHVVLACAGAADRLCADLPPINSVRGQATVFAAGDSAPRCVVCDTGYIAPPRGGAISVGATYDPHAVDCTPRRQDDATNRAFLDTLLPAHSTSAVIDGRASRRCVSHDRLPLVGGVPVAARWAADYGRLARDARAVPATPGALWPGLSVSLAHGSHGMLRAPLAAEMIASAIADTPQPVARDLVAAVHPGRWLIRQIIRGRVASTPTLA